MFVLTLLIQDILHKILVVLVYVISYMKMFTINIFLYIFQVNMMSAQMLSAASNVSGTIADLAPGAKDGMRMLEAKAAEMAFEERPGFCCYILIKTYYNNICELRTLCH